MTLFYQAASAVLIACILSLVLKEKHQSFGILLTILVCVMVLVLSIHFLDPVFVFWEQLQASGDLHQDLIRILMKITGISMISEIAGFVCKDSGNTSLGKALQYFASAVILWLSIPVFQSLLNLVQDILGGV